MLSEGAKELKTFSRFPVVQISRMFEIECDYLHAILCCKSRRENIYIRCSNSIILFLTITYIYIKLNLKIASTSGHEIYI